VLRTGRPLLADDAVFAELLERGEVEPIGPDSVDWLGVPLSASGRVIGVLAVQSYSGAVRYRPEDVEVLEFVSTQVALAIERRRSEEALRQSETRLRALLAGLPDLLFVFDREGRYLEFHAPRPGDLVVLPEEVQRRSVDDSLPPALAAQVRACIAACLDEGREQTLEYQLEVRSGPGWFESRMLPYGEGRVLALVRNITERRRAQQALRSAESELRRLTDNMLDVISQTDLSGVFQFASPSHRLVSGWTPEELVGQPALELVHPDDRARAKAALRDAVLSQGSSRAEYRFRTRDGRHIWVETVANLLRGDDGAPQAIVYGTREITKRRRAELAVELLHQVDRKVLERQPLSAIFAFLTAEIVRRFEYPLAWVGMKEPDGAVSIQAPAGPALAYTEDLVVRWDGSPMGQGPVGGALRSGRPHALSFAAPCEERLQPYRARALAHGLQAAAALPLHADGGPLGVLVVYADREDAFDAATLASLVRFADRLALSLLAASQLERIRIQTAALEAAANAVVITDREGRIQFVNQAFTELTGFSREEVHALTPRVLKSGLQSDFFYEQLWQTIRQGQVWRGELYNARKDGSLYVEEQTITPIRGDDGEVQHFIAIKQDVTARRRSEEHIRHLALHDPLTDLPNRRALEGSLERIVGRARRGTASTLLFLDLDHFKTVNDTLGHPAGDRVLVEFATLLARELRPGDEMARLGGDEFVAVLEGVPLPGGLQAAERLRASIDDHTFRVDERDFALSVSIGVVPVDGTLEPGAVLALADAALYQAKEKGRNRVAVLQPSALSASPAAQASEWVGRIKTALRENTLQLVFQPIVRIATRKAAHFEALLRLPGPDGEMVLPGRFLPSAEKFGLMPQIDRWVVERVLGLLARKPGVEVFVNLSGASLGHEALLADIEAMVRGSGIGPGRLAFEITETTAIADLSSAREWVRRLKDLGCRFALDDFGIGFSSFGYLQTLPADYVKIDGSFIRDLLVSPSNRALVKALDTVADALGKETIAEAVEDEAILPLLTELGVEFAQGYAFGQPLDELPDGEPR
jgi:diguanylate cyclase (GGDEF)-like protein/PAS domain S-box-containing protein